MTDGAWLDTVSIPYLLRHAGSTYGAAMRNALESRGYDDIPRNGLYVIGGLAQANNIQLAKIIDDLELSKQAAGHLVDTLVARGYLERQVDPQDRRRLIVSLTERGRDAAHIQKLAREEIDLRLGEKTGRSGLSALRKLLAAVVSAGRGARDDPDTNGTPILQIKGVVPILFVSNVTQAAKFYMDLGFSTDFLYGEPPFYGSVSRGSACFHLRYVARPNFAELAATEEAIILASVEVSDVHRLHAEVESRGVEISRGLVDQPWGGTDFHVRDPDGNEISSVQFRLIEPRENTE